MARLCALLVFVVVALSCVERPPDSSGAPEVHCAERSPPPAPPERRALLDCASIVDVATLPPLPDPPACPPPDPPVPSLCLDGGNAAGGVVASQLELEAYRGCTSITGNLAIQGACSLAPLSALVSVDGSLILGGGEEQSPDFLITSLEGLEALESVDRDFTIRGAPALASLDGLDALTHVGWSIDLFFLPALSRLRGPPVLADIGGALNVSFSAALMLVDGFESLATVEGGVVFGHNAALRCIGGFPALASLAQIELEDAPIEAMPGLSAVLVAAAPRLRLIDTPAFDLLTLPALESLAGIEMFRGPPVEDLSAFSGITSLGTLLLHDVALTNLGGLDTVASLEDISLSSNASLVDVSALDGVGALGAAYFSGDQEYDVRCAFRGATSARSLTFDRTSYDVIPWPLSISHIDGIMVARNGSLEDLGDVDLTVGDAYIAYNEPITNDEVARWLDAITVEGVGKYGGNAGDLLDPCPWRDDGVCDWGLCLEDSVADCPPQE